MKLSADGYRNTVLSEINMALEKIDSASYERFLRQLWEADEIFVAGAGRSGLMAKGFAMRMMHLGKRAYVVGETVTPNITSKGCLLIGTGSGETESLVAMAKKAKKIGARVLAVTIFPESSVGKLADTVVKIDAPTPKSANKQSAKSIQPMGSLFEQSLMIFFDITTLNLMEKSGQTSDKMFGRHANLE